MPLFKVNSTLHTGKSLGPLHCSGLCVLHGEKDCPPWPRGLLKKKTAQIPMLEPKEHRPPELPLFFCYFYLMTYNLWFQRVDLEIIPFFYQCLNSKYPLSIKLVLNLGHILFIRHPNKYLTKKCYLKDWFLTISIQPSSYFAVPDSKNLCNRYSSDISS